MSESVTHELWRVSLEDGTSRDVPVFLESQGWTTGVEGYSATARVAVIRASSSCGWSVVEILAPGELGRDHWRARSEAALAEVDRLMAQLPRYSGDASVVVDAIDAAAVRLAREGDALRGHVAAMLDALRSIYATVAPERARLTAETFPTRAVEVPEQFAALVASEVRDYAARGVTQVVEARCVCGACDGKASDPPCYACGGEGRVPASIEATRLRRNDSAPNGDTETAR